MARILIAEDDKDIRELIEIVLRFNGYQTIAVNDGEAVIAAATGQDFDLILLDVRMPRMDGYQACRLLRSMEKTRTVPIVMLSAKGQESEIAEGLAAGADEYILKPFTPDGLVAIIKRNLESNG